MFYAHFVLSKKGPLARIWLAAHWDKKLTKAHVFETNISSSVEAILEPKVKMALRTSGHLLLGVVRIYSRKAKYLLADCNEAFVKIKMAFRPGVVDLPEDMNREAAIAAITLPENFHDFEATMSDLAELDKNTINVNQSRPEDITMREDFGEINLGRPDDDFGDSAFDDTTKASAREQMRDAGESRLADEALAADVTSILEHTDQTVNSTKRSGVGDRSSHGGELLDDGVGDGAGGKRRRTDHDSGAGSPRVAGSEGRPEDVPDTHEDDDDFGDGMDGDFLDAGDDDDDNAVDDFGGEMDHDIFGTGIFDDPSAQKQLEHITSEFESHLDPHGFNLDVSGAEGGATPVQVPPTPRVHDGAAGELGQADRRTGGDGVHLAAPVSSAAEILPQGTLSESVVGVGGGVQHTTLMSNDGEAFALPPVDASSVGVTPAVGPHGGMGMGQQNAQQAASAPITAPARPRHTTKRKRKLIIDEQKSIPSEVMKLQMSDTSDIVSSLDLAPPTKKLMFWKETGSVEKLFAMPGRAIVSRSLLRLFARNLLTSIMPDLEEELAGVGAGGATPVTHRVHAGGPVGHLEASVTDEEATAAMLLGARLFGSDGLDGASSSLPLAGTVPEEPLDGLRAVTEMAPAGPPPPPAAQMSAILEEPSNVGLSSVLDSGAPSGVAAVSEASVLAAAPAEVPEAQPEPPPPPPPAQVVPEPVDSLSRELEAGKELAEAPAVPMEPPSQPQQPEPREDPMMPVVPRPQDTPHPTDYFAPETPAPYLNPPSIMSMGPPSVLPADPVDEECLLGAPGAAARQLEREYDEAEEEMDEALRGDVDENANQELLEERRLERRSKVMLKMLRHVLATPESNASFDTFVSRNNRKQVASKFYTLLVLRKQKAVELTQTEPYGEITIAQGASYQSLLATAF